MIIFRSTRPAEFIGSCSIVAALVLPMCHAIGAESVPQGYTTGVPWTGAPGVTESVGAIMAREAASQAGTGAAARPVKPRFVRNLKDLPQNPAAPLVASWPLSRTGAGPSGTGPLSPQTVSTSFLGAQFSDTVVGGSGLVPPDSMGDVGPTQIIVCVNGRIRSFNRSGVTDGALNTGTDNFFASVLGGSSTSDPRVRFDRLSGRWFITMITVNTPNLVLLAVSSGPTITSGSSFTFYSFQADPSNFGDYDTLGVDANAVYVGLNIFNGNTFVNTTGFVVNKANLLTGTLTVTTFANLIVTKTGHGPPVTHGPFTPHGVNNDDPAATEGYFIGVDAASLGTLVVRRIADPGGTPSISTNILITVPATAQPMGSVPALGSSSGLDDLDDRLFATRMHNGSLWTAHNIEVDGSGTASSSGGRDGSRWYEITNLTGTPTLAQSGTLFDPAGSNPRNFWIPSCAMSGQGHMALGCSAAGNSEHAEIAVAGSLASDPPGSIQSPTTAVTTSTTYNIGIQNGKYRWGDFSVTTVDPNDDMTMWTVQEYCNATDSWGVRVIRLNAPPPATPTNCSPASVSAGATNVNLVVTGASVAGSGFFDPGPGFTNHISAAIGGGVTINNVVYTDPTHVTLNVSVSGGAANGTRTITITNPDGQSATSATGILTITGGTATNSAPVLPAISNKSVNELSALVFTNSATDSDGDALTYSLDPGAPTNATINATTGVFSWTPTEAQGPATNSITVRVTDNGSPALSDAKTFTVVVNEVNQAPVLAPIANRTVHAGMTLGITNSATDADIPTNTLTFSLDPGAPAGAGIDPGTGVFSWSPGDGDANTTNDITVRVTDNGSPPLSDAKSFAVIVVSRPVLQVASLSNNVITITWTAIAGQSYRVQYKTDLYEASWTDLPPDVLAAGSTASKSDSILSDTQKFYRVLVLP